VTSPGSRFAGVLPRGDPQSRPTKAANRDGPGSNGALRGLDSPCLPDAESFAAVNSKCYLYLECSQ